MWQKLSVVYPQHLPAPTIPLLLSASSCESPPEGPSAAGTHSPAWGVPELLGVSASRRSSPPVMERINGSIPLLGCLSSWTRQL